MNYIPTIGLEIHIELKTKTKMFCGSLNDSDEKHPNINICPICTGHPGVLPVINKEAVRKVLLMAKALNGKIARYSRFDRKNYFYPDLPKGYQISQYKYPLVIGGELNGVKIIRIHLEEDAGKLVHTNEGSLVDFNRAGVPLMELVTEPDIKTGEEAKKFAEELQLILRYLDVSDADMEKGQMRVEANISVRDGFKLGTKVEIKNINSFRIVEQAINYEIKRQTEILESGEKVVRETRGWNENKQQTFSQREKEESHDYRYFPEPDLPLLELLSVIFQQPAIPELPRQKRGRFKKEYKLNSEQTEIFIRNKKFADYFEAVASEISGLCDVKTGSQIQLAANYLTTDLQSLMKEKMLSFDELLITPENFAELIAMIIKKEITSRTAKDILKIMSETGADPSLIADERNLRQISDESAIKELVERIINENFLVAEDYKKGKAAAGQFLIGQAIKKTKGTANPEVLKEMFEKVIHNFNYNK